MTSVWLRQLGVTFLGAFTGSVVALFILEHCTEPFPTKNITKLKPQNRLPTRFEQIEALRNEEYDVLVIGGGVIGAGCALEAMTRGLKTALVDAGDFASETSSKSTKLIHGGVRYLHKALFGLDYKQFLLVKNSLQERATILEIAPHLTQPLPIMLPIYRWDRLPFYWLGLKCYDFIASGKNIKSSYFITREAALQLFPLLKKDKLCGAIVYYDAQMDDARLCLAIALTAARHGAAVCNYLEVKDLLRKRYDTNKEAIIGAKVKDHISGKEFNIRAKCVVNATGSAVDVIRKMDDPYAAEICLHSSGVHIVLPEYCSPHNVGLLDPATADGRMIFFLPWKGHTIVGTTDLPCKMTHHPNPTEEEVSFLLKEVNNYINPIYEVRRDDIMSTWSGIRALIRDPHNRDTKSILRTHLVEVSESHLITIAGGKWTTYRAMAEKTINVAVAVCRLEAMLPNSITANLKIEGAHGWSPDMYMRLMAVYDLDYDTAKHLANSYGDRAYDVCRLSKEANTRMKPLFSSRIRVEFPYIDAEIRYGVVEYACTAVDMIARRLRLAFLNAEVALDALPIIVDIMAEELNWSPTEKQRQIQLATKFLTNEMGLKLLS